MILMAKGIAVIGDSESVKGFGAVGLESYVCDKPEDAAQLLKTVTESDKYAVIYMTEELFEITEKERAKFSERITPAIIPIPGVRGNTGVGMRRLSSFVEKAVGSDILFKN